MENNNWIKTTAVFANDLHELGIEDETHEDFYFNAKDVIAFNRSSTECYTTIWIGNTSITITMPIEDVEKIVCK